MSDEAPRRRKTLALSELVAGVIAPVSDRRGYILADLRAAWPEIVGPRYADCSEPDRIDWPRGDESGKPAQLRVRAEGPKSVLLQHELGQLMERLNAYLGYGAVDRIKLVQAPVSRKARPRATERRAVDEARLASAVSTIADDPLKDALKRLGRGVFGDKR